MMSTGIEILKLIRQCTDYRFLEEGNDDDWAKEHINQERHEKLFVRRRKAITKKIYGGYDLMQDNGRLSPLKICF